MKKQLMLLILIVASMAYEASATTIVIKGGSRNNLFREVIVKNEYISCIGRGNNACPVNWATGTFNSAVFPVKDVVDAVSREIKNGNLTGDLTFNERMPVKWSAKDGENLQIDFPAKLTVTESANDKE